jgi:hypothetical protein
LLEGPVGKTARLNACRTGKLSAASKSVDVSDRSHRHERFVLDVSTPWNNLRCIPILLPKDQSPLPATQPQALLPAGPRDASHWKACIFVPRE